MKSIPKSEGPRDPDVLEGACQGELHPQAVRGIREYNAGEYYEAHEYLELAWRDTKTAERDLYQGVLQVGVAYYQIQRGNYRGALKMFQRARGLLGPLPNGCRGIAVAQLRKDAEKVERVLRDLGPARIGDFDPGLFQPVPMLD